MTDDTDRGRLPSRVRLTVYGICFVVCALSYLRVLPAPLGIVFAAGVPLVWAVEAYRRQSRLAFLFAALVPLLRFLR